jgi:tRNA modification GTPase
VALWDAPGDLDDPGEVDATALALRDRLAGGAGAAVCVLDATAPSVPGAVRSGGLPLLAVVWSKCDRVAGHPVLPEDLRAALPADVPVLETSSVLRTGLQALRELLVRSARSGAGDAGGPLREALQRAAAAVARAQDAAAMGPEVAAVELQAALRALDDLGGRHSPEHLLDRIYGRFCLGK